MKTLVTTLLLSAGVSVVAAETVAVGESLTRAVAAAQPGDTLVLAGRGFSTDRSCSTNHSG